MHRSNYRIEKITPDLVLIVDRDGPLSVTNDAERVCQELHEQYGNRRIIYLDTMGNWDELVHEAGTFKGYAPATCMQCGGVRGFCGCDPKESRP